ncbi:carbohydrate sulfotransferase 1-like [Palaemon carinicauda]|uniref:carbohydrate sulfotransferase 1-like n=1 Tax=Palaemon carinicauda TaxID=392227 RepID=UPI0035B5AB9A
MPLKRKHVLLALAATAGLYLAFPPKHSPGFSRGESPEGVEPCFQLNINDKELLMKQKRSYGSNGRPPKAVILWSTWRSGSTFVGGLLANAVTETFYSIEPLYSWKNVINSENNSATSSAQEFLHDLMHCRVQQKYMKQLFTLIWNPYYRDWNRYYTRKCRQLEACGNVTLLTQMCQEARIHVAKVVRLSLRWAWRLLEDENLDLKIVYLGRDPRAVLASRSFRGFCKQPSCNHPQTVCELLQDDLEVAAEMIRKYPHKFQYLQYEDIATDPLTGLGDLMAFVGLPVSDKQLELLNPSDLDPYSPYGISKISELEVNKWRKLNNYSSVFKYQEACTIPICMMGLRIFRSGEEFRNLSLPVLPDPPQP